MIEFEIKSIKCNDFEREYFYFLSGVNNNGIGEAFYVNDDNEEFPYYWCKIVDGSFTGYNKLHSDSPVFTLSIGEIAIRDNGSYTFDIMSSNGNDTFSIRTTNESILCLWRCILTQYRENKLSAIDIELL